MSHIEIYTKPTGGCFKCVEVKRYLDQMEIGYEEKQDVDELKERAPDCRSFPGIFFNGDFLADLKALKSVLGDIR